MTGFVRRLQSRLRAIGRDPGPRRPQDDPSGRIPPGQRVVDRFPVLDLGHRPKIRPADWRLTLKGAVERPQRIDWAQLNTLPMVDITCDIHCVTRWSRLDVPWRGVRLRDVLALAGPRPEARHALLHGMDGYSANLPLEMLLADDALLAIAADGKPLSTEHGGPVRALVPSRYFWKSSKWLVAISLHAEDEPGFWETRGYHNEGDPFRNSAMPDPRPEIGPGSRVTLHYTVMLETGLVVDSTEGDAPLEFTLGDGTFIQGLELAMMGLRAGDTQTLRIGPESAFGFHDPDGIQELTRADFPGDMEPEVGQIIGFTTPAGDEILAAVKEIDGERIVMDFNHPLAGHEITFSVEILDVLPGA